MSFRLACRSNSVGTTGLRHQHQLFHRVPLGRSSSPLCCFSGLGREVLRTPRRLCLQGDEEVRPPLAFVRNDDRLMEMLHSGSLYRRDSAGSTVLPEFHPGAGPFHVFLSHNWKHGQEKMRIVKSELREMVPGISVFLDVDNLGNGRDFPHIDVPTVSFASAPSGGCQPSLHPRVVRAVLRKSASLRC